jgi:hypothetical protein
MFRTQNSEMAGLPEMFGEGLMHWNSVSRVLAMHWYHVSVQEFYEGRLSGHGTSADALVLQDDHGRPKHVSKEGIVSAIAFGSESVKLVFFNTCFSFNQAQSCVENVNAAIGMNREIGDEGARVFSSQFYSGIGFGHSIPKAFAQAKSALMMEDLAQADIPELHLKEGLSEEELTLVRPRQI